MKSKKLISHLLPKTVQNEITEEIICFYESPETFTRNLMAEMKPATIKAYTELLLAKVRMESRTELNLLLSVDQIIQMCSRYEVNNDDMEMFHRILDVLALTLYFNGTDDNENSLEELNLFTQNDQKNFYISHLLFKSLLDRGFIRDKEQSLVRTIMERLTVVIKEESRGMSQTYCIAVETIKLLFDEKIINPLKFLARILKPLRKTNIESFAVILCDFIEYVPNKKLGLCQAMNMLNELDLFLLLEKSARKVKNPEIDTKRCFFLLKNCVELFRELNLPYKSDLMSWDPEKAREYGEAWDKFFSIVESLKENMKHLIIPAFGLLEQLDILGPRWKICLLERGFQNDNSSVQTFCASYLLRSKDLWPEIGNGIDSAFTGVINNTSLFSNKDLTFDNDRYCEFVQTHPDFVQFDQLQKSVPIYFTVKGLFGRMEALNENEQSETLECLNKILSSLNMVHNTLIRAEIIDRVANFICNRQLYNLLFGLNLAYLLEPNEGTLTVGMQKTFEVPWETLVAIYDSSLPLSLKRKFTAEELDFQNSQAPKMIFVHAYLNQSKDQSKEISNQLFVFSEMILSDFLRSLESDVLPSNETTSAIEELIFHGGSLFEVLSEKITQLSVLRITNPLTPVLIKATLAQILRCVSQNEDLCGNGTIRTSLEFLTDSMQLMCKTDTGQSKGRGDGEIFSKYYQSLSVVKSKVFQRYGAHRVKISDELEFTLYLMDVGGSRILTFEMESLKV